MKKLIVIIALIVLAFSVWAGGGMSVDWSNLKLTHSQGEMSFTGIGGSLTLNPTWKETGLQLTSHIGVATVISAGATGENGSTIWHRSGKTWNYHASLGIGYEMQTAVGLRAGFHVFWNDTTFTEGGRLGGTYSGWDRTSYHVFGWGLTAGMSVRANQHCIIGFSVTRDSGIAACTVQRSRHDWDTSEGAALWLTDISFTSWKVSLTVTAEV